MALTWTPHLRVTWGGPIGAARVEEWSNGLRWYIGNDQNRFTDVQCQQIADRTFNVMTNWIGDQGSNIHADAKLEWAKAVWILNTGKQDVINTPVHLGASLVPGSITLTPVIWEQTYALTLRTALRRGRTHAGRVFPPLSGQGPDSGTPYCSDGNAELMAARFAFAMNSLATAIGTITPAPPAAGHFAVFSPGDSVKGTSPMHSKITGVVCDRVADIQHRRTNRVPRLEGTLAPLA